MESLLAYGPAAESFMEVPALEVTHDVCAHEAHIGIVRCVPKSVPKRGPSAIIRQPTPTKLPIKTGLKSSISGPFCDFRQP